MWAFFSRLILRNRITILILLTAITVTMGYYAQFCEITYEFPKLMPDNDTTLVQYKKFHDNFGEEGNILIMAIKSDSLYNLDMFNQWYDLGNMLKKIKVLVPVKDSSGETHNVLTRAVDSVFSVGHLFLLNRNDAEKKFDLAPIISKRPTSQPEVDSIKAVIERQLFYKDLLYNDSSNSSIMMCFLNEQVINTRAREYFMDSLILYCADFSKKYTQIRYSGLPYIRTSVASNIRDESSLFVVLAAIITALILLVFFRSFKVMGFCMLVVGIAAIWSMGTVGWFGYKITGLMSLIPPLVIVIGIPNCIYLLNKYHQEYSLHGNKIRSLSRIIQKIGNATFMTNATTAMGFATFIFTSSQILVEFGIIASINVLLVFFLSITLIPIVFSFLSDPKPKQTKHLDKKWVEFSIKTLIKIVSDYRKLVYLTTFVLILVGAIGIRLIKTTGNPTDDLPDNSEVKLDLKMIEDNFNGVMPFEILIDTKKKKFAKKEKTLLKVEKVQNLLATYPEFSKTISVVDAIKFARHSFYGAQDPSNYRLIRRKDSDAKFINPYLKGGEEGKILHNFMDSSQQTLRITAKMRDIGTNELEDLLNEIEPRVDSILNPDKVVLTKYIDSINTNTSLQNIATNLYAQFPKIKSNVERLYMNEDTILAGKMRLDNTIAEHLVERSDFKKHLLNAIDLELFDASYTGSMVIFLKGTNYLVKSLFVSVFIAIFVIAILMALLFSSFRMVLVSLIPNLIPLLITGSIMGYFGIPIKPSTILVFSIAFGISVDDTIHYLAKYRQELKLHRWDIGGSVILALKETGVSMMYTSIILFFGFSVFIASDFGGTKALGILIAITLIVAMFSNLILLPSLLLSLEKRLTTKAFEKEPLIQILNEEEDIELDDLVITKNPIAVTNTDEPNSVKHVEKTLNN